MGPKTMRKMTTTSTTDEDSIVATPSGLLASKSQASRSRLKNMNPTCIDSYKLFKRCSTLGDIETVSCGDVVMSYMMCSMNDCLCSRFGSER